MSYEEPPLSYWLVGTLVTGIIGICCGVISLILSLVGAGGGVEFAVAGMLLALVSGGCLARFNCIANR